MTDTPSNPDRRPHMVMVVGNQVVGDSRVEKSAVTAEQAGYRVTVLGTARRTVFPIGEYHGIPIYRTPAVFRRQSALNQWKSLRPSVSPTWGRLADADGTPTFGPGEPLPAPGAGAGRSWRDRLAENVELARDRVVAKTPGGWRTVWPHIADYEELFLPPLLHLAPDVIHTHDRHPLAAVHSYVQLMRSRGRTIPWLYDAHEWVPGQEIVGGDQARIGWVAAEAELIRHADAVISVTDELAGRMKSRHRLPERPTVVHNAPLAAKTPLDPEQRLPLRQECGLDEDTPLLVYIGRLADVRGIFTIIDALAQLPGVHAAFVGNQDDAYRQRMRDHAAQIGVDDRLHIADYVPSSSVTWYIQGATCGVSPLMPTPAHELAIPTKLREYLQSGLPLVVSDLTEQAAFTRDGGLGTVFAPGQADSLAGAVQELLDRLPDFRAAVRDPEVQAQHTWEGSEQVLTELWHRLCPVPDAAAGPAGVEPAASETAGPVLAVVAEAPEDQPLVHAWRDQAGPVEPVPGVPVDGGGRGPALKDALDRWIRVDRAADGVLYTGAVNASGSLDGGFSSEVRSLLERGKPVAVWTAEAPLADPRLLAEAYEGHPFSMLPREAAERYRRQVRRSAQPLLDLQAGGNLQLLTSRQADARLLGALWCPVPVPTPTTDRYGSSGWAPEGAQDRPVQVLVVPTLRTPQEEQALDRMAERAEAEGLEILRPRHRKFRPAMAATADLVIDALHLGESSDAAAWAWRSGRIVVGQSTSAPAAPEEAAAPAAPVVQAGDHDLTDRVLELAESLRAGEAGELLRASHDYGTLVHDGRLSVRVIRSALGL
ncbi:glycosyltransferase family 4 protein [Citricoccus sp. I39-566]|uniref:glycosyltransferase family 4 protein n=1 Tax=Citricoccus sp. I39-566 TaxID=3073268 RepID=UPI00286BBB2B|nr:glycosyltransferase family 4 protein [Citricoccus sp. I39-566]WMY77081.1 glycosyltransferase family 4 protein [Citricoccus sp. I39-566]